MSKPIIKTVILFTLVTLIGACGPAATTVSPTATSVPPSPTAVPPTATPTDVPPTPAPPSPTMTPTATPAPTMTPAIVSPSPTFTPQVEPSSFNGTPITLNTVGQVELLSTLSGHSNHVTSLAFSRDGSFIASASMDNTIRLWDVISGQEAHTFRISAACVHNIAFSPAGRLLASWEAIWDVETKQIVHALEQGECAAVAFSPDGTTLAVANNDGATKLWDVSSGQVVRTLDDPASNLSHGIAFSPDGARLAVHREPNAMVKLWDVESGQLLRTWPQITEKYLHGVAFSPDGQLLASAGTEGTTLVWDVREPQSNDVATGQVLHTLQGNSCWDVTFSPDGSLLATAGCDSTIRLWDTATWQLVRTLNHGGNVMAVVFSPDGTLLASGAYDSKICLWGIPHQE
jgi:WD40 repeat protein